MKKPSLFFSFTLIILVASSFAPAFGQYRKKTKTVRKKSITVGKSVNQDPSAQCTSLSASGERMTYLVGAGKLSRADKKRIQEGYGPLIIPEGETERAKEIRRKALEYRQKKTEQISKSSENWLKEHPNATAEQIKNHLKEKQFVLNYYSNAPYKPYVSEKRWDWRENRIDVGPVLNQGDKCNTCWAFAAADAAWTSLQITEWKTQFVSYHLDEETGSLTFASGISEFLPDSEPFVQDLLNCMEIPPEKICNQGWHGLAFDFMVNKLGIPMAAAGGREYDQTSGKRISVPRVYKQGKKFPCQPKFGFKKAVNWDYVNSPPDLVPTVEQLKEALIEHGPLVAPLVFDNCFRDYKSGVFNEKTAGKVGHVVLLIGWDDEKQAWLVKNSWGEEWGEKGFAWIKYGSNNIGAFAAWIEAEL